jgi:general secretion pathway protein A
VGEVGTGKTTLLNAALDRLDDKTKVAFIFNTNVTFEQMLNMVLYDLGLAEPSEKLSKVDAIQRLNTFAIEQLGKGGNVVLIVDEAQHLDSSAMEELRLLSNLETRKHKLVQIVLSGQPELDIKLSQHDLRQVTQRISLRRYISPLDEKDTYRYLEYRLKVSNYPGSSLFSKKAQQMIWEYSGGIPRKINILCDNALLIGYGLKQKTIRSTTIKEAAGDLTWGRFVNVEEPLDSIPLVTNATTDEIKTSRRPFAFAAMMVFIGCMVIAGFVFVGRPGVQFPRVAAFIKDVKERTLKTVNPKTTIQPKQLTLYSAPEPRAVVKKNVTKGVPITKEETEPQVKEDKISGQNASLQNIALHDEKENVPAKTIQEVPVKDGIKNRYVKVKKGEFLSRIIIQTYGAFDTEKLNMVLKANPNVVDPDRIFVDQIIKLPVD